MLLFSLKEELTEVEKEHSRMPKKEELEQLIKQLTRETEQLKDEIHLVSRGYVKNANKVTSFSVYIYSCLCSLETKEFVVSLLYLSLSLPPPLSSLSLPPSLSPSLSLSLSLSLPLSFFRGNKTV